MATDADICNLALGFLGDRGTVSSIDPPEGSIQAGHCQRFYPIARDTLLQDRNWGFATRRAQPAGLEVEIGQWFYEYALPADTLDVIAVVPSESVVDYSALLYQGAVFSEVVAKLQAQPYTVESADDGTPIIYTNQPEATILYVVRVTDTDRFTPMFVNALARLLASYLAGPVIKGDAGVKESINQLRMFQMMFAKADTKDANQNTTHDSIDYIPSGIQARS
jgi:hypothetical protein